MKPFPPNLSNRIALPPLWKTFIDQDLLNYVKQQYSPVNTWKTKPFCTQDIAFFTPSILELSERYQSQDYNSKLLTNPKFRSAYLLYFLPLQAAKFLNIYTRYISSLYQSFKDASDVWIFADMGAGPATASIAFLLSLNEQILQQVKKIEFHLVDINFKLLQNGKDLLGQLAKQKGLEEKITIYTHQNVWWKSISQLPRTIDFLAFGNVLNESHLDAAAFLNTLNPLFIKNLFVLEPATAQMARKVCQLRDLFLEKKPYQVVGPCLHNLQCPLQATKDWCHFSIPSFSLGKTFDQFCKSLGAPREYLKFSFFWLTTLEEKAYKPTCMKRVVSDVVKQGKHKMVLLCQPEQVQRFTLKPQHFKDAKRGGLMDPMT